MKGPFLGLSYMVAYVACYGIQNEPSMTKPNFDGIGIAERQEEVPKCKDNPTWGPNNLEIPQKFASAWCGTNNYWGCDVSMLVASDTRNTANVDYQCDCKGVNANCPEQGCENSIPSTCSMPEGFTCSHLASFCEKKWSDDKECGSTPGLVKDNCKETCGSCGGKTNCHCDDKNARNGANKIICNDGCDWEGWLNVVCSNSKGNGYCAADEDCTGTTNTWSEIDEKNKAQLCTKN